MSQRTLLLLSQDNNHYERLLKAARLPHLHILRADNQSDAEKMIGDAHILMAEPARARPLLAKADRLSWLQSTYAGSTCCWMPAAAVITCSPMCAASSGR